jgi:hypothetical protein
VEDVAGDDAEVLARLNSGARRASSALVPFVFVAFLDAPNI